MVADDELQAIDGFHRVNLIAQGNNTDVWEVRDPAGSQFAMKLLKTDMMKERPQVQTLKHEARVCKAIEHPNLVKFHKASFTKQHAYLLMEYFRAPSVKNQLMSDRTVLHVRFRKLVEQTCLVLQFMHDKGWVHRDIKPDNILINKASELRLIDFSLTTRSAGGLAGLIGGKAKIIQGTRTYIAPETIRRKPATFQTDMYSLGVTLFEILTGRPPFKASTPDELLRQHLQTKPPAPSDFYANVSPEMDRLILRMLEKKPAKRPKTMNEVYAEFRALKPFVEDPQELFDREDTARRERDLDGLRSADSILNSRADADRRAAGITAPARKGKARAIQAVEVYRDGEPVRPAPAAAAQAPAMPPGPPAMPQPPGTFPYPPPPMPPGPMPMFQQPPMPWPQPAWPQPPYPGYAGPPPGFPGTPGAGPQSAPPGGPLPVAAVQPAPAPPQPSPPASAPAGARAPATPTPARAPAPAQAAPAAARGGESRPAATGDRAAAAAAKPVQPAAPASGMVLTFASEPDSERGAAQPAPVRAKPAAAAQGSNGTKAPAPGGSPAAPRKPPAPQPTADDDLPLMEELPEVI